MPAPATLVEFARSLIRRRSVTPDDAGCQDELATRLAGLGFAIEQMPFGPVRNLWARRGTTAPVFAFAGHTDVVPSGPAEQWQYPPFAAQVHDGMLYGRGAADMKGSLAAMLIATAQFVATQPHHHGSIAFLLTSDEEGDAVNGTRRVMDTLNARGERLDWCVVGEPTSHTRVGDTIKVGRRGSLSARLRIVGKQGHVAYPQLADNPVHRAGALIAELAATEWDTGDAEFPPTSFQISNVAAGTGAGNVIPGHMDMQFNFRFSPQSSEATLRDRVARLCAAHGLNVQLDWTLFGEPFKTPHGTLVDAVCGAIHDTTGLTPDLSTSGGTSDGRFIAPSGTQVVELGPVNATIHKIDECVAVADLDRLADLYYRILERLLC